MPVKSVPIVLSDGKERELRFDYNALVRLEDELGFSVSEIGKLMAGTGSLKQIRAILWAALSHADKALNVEEVGALIDLAKLGEIAGKIAEAFQGAFPVEEEPKKGSGPNPEKSESPGTGENT